MLLLLSLSISFSLADMTINNGQSLELFAPKGTHCSDYVYNNQNVNQKDYVSTGMKANQDITITEVTVGSIATFDCIM